MNTMQISTHPGLPIADYPFFALVSEIWHQVVAVSGDVSTARSETEALAGHVNRYCALARMNVGGSLSLLATRKHGKWDGLC